MTFLEQGAQELSQSALPGDPRRYLLSEVTAEDYRRTVAEGAERVAAKIAKVDRPATGISVAALEPEIRGIDLERPLSDSAAALDELERIYLRDAVYFHHPRYLAHLNCPIVIPALLGETVLSSINSSLDTWDQSVGGTLIERRLIDWTTDRIGFGSDADGVFTSGGTQSNLQAMLVAREDTLRRVRLQPGETEPDIAILPKLRIFASENSHFSVIKAARMLGLGDGAVIAVASDAERRMQPLALQQELAHCLADGLIPMAVVATAGTTDFGSIDPLPEIANLCERYGVWMHVDAAYGCGLLVSRRRHKLDGIEYANSVTVDFHKSFFQPVSSSALLVADGTTLGYVTYHADYLNPKHSAKTGAPNQVDKSIQTTRRFDALKLWLTLRIMGADAVGELFDEVIDRAYDAWLMLQSDSRFEVVTEPELSTLVFRYIPWEGASPELCDRANLHARSALFASGEAMVAGTKVDGHHYLKFTLLNPRTTLHDIATVLDLLAAHAAELADAYELSGSRAS
ncbi:MAG: pyridoxal-dependent decarboxylase [Amycolatopsis sp.]|jgi:L-2,4-diaminobutyrate decarboxylase|uniref:pyridoxal phosphate-dependent decarboxylase family protein n=1 Tax=Amycolatopsis sp. TaxID=37632 RepID=UPI002607D027|nr:aspartate aminotransferase family protein [Amycolatopsis sp.]MCU1681457.1 pyridoxal-dependent decarboxylase [Amycolatopsis sp.]